MYKVGYLIAIIGYGDFRNYYWLKEVAAKCEKLILGIPETDIVKRILGSQYEYNAEEIVEYWENIKWIDDIYILDKDHLSYLNPPKGLIFDVCFYGSEYGTLFQHIFHELCERHIDFISLMPEKATVHENIDSLKPVLDSYIGYRKIVLFGTGAYFDLYIKRYGKCNGPAYAIDNNSDKWGSYKSNIEICAPEKLLEENPECVLVILCSKNYTEMLRQLQSLGTFEYRTLIRKEEVSVIEETLCEISERDKAEDTLHKIQDINYDMLEEFDAVCRNNDIEYFLNYGSILGSVRHKGFIPWDNDVDIAIKRNEYEKLYEHKNEFSDKYIWIDESSLDKNKYYDSVSRIGYRYAHIHENVEACEYYNNLFNGIHLDLFFIDKTRNDFWGKFQRFELAFIYGLMNAYRHSSMFADYDFKMRLKNNILCAIGRFIPLSFLRKIADKVARRFNNDLKAKYYFISNDALCKLYLLFPEEIFSHAVDVSFGRVTARGSCEAEKMCQLIFGDYLTPPPVEQQVPHCGRVLLRADMYEFER